MLHHPIYLEDYIVCLCELSDIATPGVTAENMIRLSKFDRNPIRKIANQVKHRRVGFTIKQIDFVKLLLHKYRKQLTVKQVNLDNLDQVPLLFAIRTIEQRRSLTLVDGMLSLEFNFNSEYIRIIREFVNEGRCQWSSDEHRWKIYPSECNLDFFMDFATKHNFFVADEVCNLHRQLIQFKQQHDMPEFSIELQLDGTIKNAAPELVDYLAENNVTDLMQLCDNAYLYKYDISSELSRLIYHMHEHRSVADQTTVWGAICSRTMPVSAQGYLALAQDYCKLVGRGPIILVLTERPDQQILDLATPVSADMKQDAVYYICPERGRRSGLFGVPSCLQPVPQSQALIITDTDQLDWHFMFRSMNKIWYIKKEPSADKNTN